MHRTVGPLFLSLLLYVGFLAACEGAAPVGPGSDTEQGDGAAGGPGTAGDAGRPEGGTGGSGGTGGAGGSAGAIGSGGVGGSESAAQFQPPSLNLPDEVAWLDDPDTWQLLPEPTAVWDKLCYFRQAAPERIQFPPLEWESCGDGCARANVYQGHGNIAARPEISIALHGGVATPYLHFNQAGLISGKYGIQIQRSVDLSSGRTVAAVEQVMDQQAGFAWCGPSAVLTSGIMAASSRNRGDLPSLLMRGTFDLEARQWLWQLPWVTTDDMGFIGSYCNLADMEAGGRTFYLCGNLVRSALSPGSSAITILARPGDEGFWVEKGAALDDLAIWSELSRNNAGSRIRGWKPDGEGVRTLLAGISVDTCSVGLCTTHVAGFSTANGCASHQPNGRLWIADRTAADTIENVRIGPVFWPRPVVEVGDLSTWGGYIAAVWKEEQYETPADRQRLLIARTSDWSMRVIRAPDGHEVWETGLAAGRLYAVYTVPGAGNGTFTYVYRYELDRFESIGQAIAPVAEAGDP